MGFQIFFEFSIHLHMVRVIRFSGNFLRRCQNSLRQMILFTVSLFATLFDINRKVSNLLGKSHSDMFMDEPAL